MKDILFKCNNELSKWLTMTDDEYHGTTGISSTDIRKMLISPYNFYCHKMNKTERNDTPAMVFGRLAHAALLEPSRFRDKYRCEPKLDKRTKEGRIEYTKWLNEIPKDAITISEKDAVLLEGMISRLWSHDKVKSIFSSPGKAEQSGFWIDKATGIVCKTRIDFFTDDDYLIELKTSENASPKEFSRTIYNYGYHYQLAWNIKGYKEITGKQIKDAIFVVSEKSAPFDCAIYKASKSMIDIATLEIESLMVQLKNCFDNNDWHGYSNDIEEIDIPAYGYTV